MQSFQPIAVFLGPSLKINEARAILDADYYPPARKGDIYRIIPSGVKTIILIDGVLHRERPVWQREILDAIDAGIKVYGASGVGALRATELQAYGMKGYGTIFEWYRDGIIDGDDEIALNYGSESDNYCPLSEPLVNIRYTLLNTVKHNCLTKEQAEELVKFAKQLYYPDRSYQQLLKSPVLQQLSHSDLAKIETYLIAQKIDLKRLDAIKLLTWQADFPEKPDTVCRNRDRLESPMPEITIKIIEMAAFVKGEEIRTGRELFLAVKQDANLLAQMQIKLSKHCFIREWAKQNRVFYPQQNLESDITEWEKLHDIVCDSQWLQSNGLTLCSYRKLMCDRLSIDWIVNQGPEYFGLDWNLDRTLQEEVQVNGKNSPSISQAELTALRYKLSQRCFILTWAKQNGIYPDPLLAEIAFEEWVLKQGPNYFGIPWSFPTALCRELQITGKAANLLKNN